MDARWIDADRLMFPAGGMTACRRFLPVPPNGKSSGAFYTSHRRDGKFLSIEIDENGQPVCILSTLPQVEVNPCAGER